MSKLLLKYATRGRKNLFYETINNILQYTTGEYTLVISADEDDPEMNNQEVREFVKEKKLNIIYGWSKNKVHAINRDMERFEDWDWLVNMSDDMKFIQHGWNEKMLVQIKEKWGESLDWFAHFNDGFVFDKLPTLSVMGREYYERFGYIYHPSYGSFSCDAEALYVSQMLDKYHYFPEIFYKHYHPANLPSVRVDSMYHRANAWSDRDVQTYFERMKRLFYVSNPKYVPEQIIIELKNRYQIDLNHEVSHTYSYV